jgi:hypothetical protein
MKLNVNNAHKDPHDLHHNPLPLSPEAVKKFRHREIGEPSHVRGRGKFIPPRRDQKRRWFLRSRRGTELTGAVGRIFLFFSNYHQIAGVARRKSGDCFAALHLPPILAA